MKLKKILCIVFAVLFVAAASVVIIHAAEEAEHAEERASCCPYYSYTVSTVLGHWRYGYDCEAYTRTSCNYCGEVYDSWKGAYIPCIHPGLGNFGEEYLR